MRNANGNRDAAGRTAICAYKETEAKAKDLLKKIQAEVRKAGREAVKDSKSWTHQGSMSYVVEQLTNLHNFLTGQED